MRFSLLNKLPDLLSKTLLTVTNCGFDIIFNLLNKLPDLLSKTLLTVTMCDADT